jgi:transcriptional regulator with XRE-family HTH domain
VDMQIDSTLIKAEREKRAWSQEHLAAVAGIGLRTLQRVESTGIASNETAKALAAVLESSLDELRIPTPRRRTFWKRAVIAGAAVACSILTAVLITAGTHAKEIMLDVVFKSSAESSSTFKMVVANGKGTEARLEKEARLVFVPTLQDNNLILITVDIYGYDGANFKLISQPKVLTRNGNEARIQVGLEGGKIYDLQIKPSLI